MKRSISSLFAAPSMFVMASSEQLAKQNIRHFQDIQKLVRGTQTKLSDRSATNGIGRAQSRTRRYSFMDL